jgi:CRP-like cAMP-binding protein
MSMIQQATRNRLLAALPTQERELIAANSTLVPLNRRDILYDAGRTLEHVYFIEDGIVSILSLVSERTGVETATIGREGTVGMAAFHGVNAAPERAMVQVPGAAYRIDVSAFREVLPKMPALDTMLHRFAVVMFSLASQNSACNRKHSIEARCARWLLSVADRLDSATMELTHDFVAQMLGVRRASVTEALNSLEARGFISTARGRITLVDRVGLEGVACSCYAMIAGVVGKLLDGRN